MFRNILLAAALLGPVAANAASLDGDTVNFDLDPTDANRVYTVGAGIDGSIGLYDLDFNAGGDGDEFLWYSTTDNVSTGGNSTLVMSSLDFDMGHVLVGFEIYDTAFSNLSFSTTDTSITFTWDLQSSTDLGNVIYGKFLTRPAAEVPLPAGAPLLFGGLALLGAVRRRSKKAS